MALNGFLRATIPATTNCASMTSRVSRVNTAMIAAKAVSTAFVFPAAVMSRNMPNMYTGSIGTMATDIVLVMTVRNSMNPRLSTTESANIMPSPRMNDSTSALITSIIAGICIVT